VEKGTSVNLMVIGLSEISLQVLFNYWAHVEFTSTQGVQHFHCLAKLPHVLDTEFIGHMTQNGRVVCQELKCGNIKPGNEQEAWEIVELGLLANRYSVCRQHINGLFLPRTDGCGF